MPVPRLSPLAIQKFFTHKVLKMLLTEGKITEATVQMINSWRYSGFNVGNHVYIASNDPEGLEGLVQYIARASLSQEKILVSEDKVIYHSKLNPSLKRNFQVYDPLEWIAAITVHIPDKGQQMIRYYGYYSNVKRGKRKRQGIVAEYLIVKELPFSSGEYRKRWAQLIKKVYEVDPLICPECGGKMSIIAFVTEQPVIDRILTHLDLLEEHSHSPPQEALLLEELTYEPCYDDFVFAERACVK